MKIVQQRIDALTLGFRARLSPEFVGALEGAALDAKEHGEAAVQYAGVVGAIKYSRSDRAWLVTNRLWRARFMTKGAPGRVVNDDGTEEPGWTTEIVWSAQALAEIGCAGAVDESAAAVRSVGEVQGDPRTRRVDLCVDVAGALPSREMAERLVKAARCEHHDYPFDEARVADDVEAGANVFWLKRVTGFRAGRGDVVLRVYDKREHLKALPQEVRDAEEARWRAGGWDGVESVMRIEIQLRGQVLAELGMRNAARPHDPVTGEAFNSLEDVLDRVWRRVIRVAPDGNVRGFRLTVVRADRPLERQPAAERATDPLWEIAYGARFSANDNRGEQGRIRVRGGASVEQCLGCDLSSLAARERLSSVDVRARKRLDERADAERAEQFVRRELEAIAILAATVRADHLVARWGAVKAYEHVGVIRNAKVARFTDPREVARTARARGLSPPSVAAA